MDCKKIHYEQNESLICAGLPDSHNSNNPRTIQIKNTESLTSYIRSRDIEGDLFSIAGYILYDCQCFDDVRENLYHIVQWICNVLEYDIYSFEKKPKVEKIQIQSY